MKVWVASALLSASAVVSAQTTPVPMAPVKTITAPPGTIAVVGGTAMAVLRVGTEVPLKTSEELTTKEKALRVGQRFRMEVAEDIKVDGQVVVPVGSPATGEITDVRNKGGWGKSGHFSARILYLQANGRQIRLSGTFDDKGVTGTAGVVAAIALVPIAGFFATGTSAKIPMGSSVKAFVDEDVPLAFASTPSEAPMVVTPAAAIATSPVAVKAK